MRSIPLLLLLALPLAAAAFEPLGKITEEEKPAVGWGELGYTAPKPGSYALPPLSPAADGEVLRADGARARLHELYDDQIVLLSFIYSTCSDLNGCPLATSVMQRIRERVAERPALRDRLRILSLSFDPQHDTPEVMRLYGSGNRDGRSDWLFLTTESDDTLQPILDDYGQYAIREYDEQGNFIGTFSHILRVVLIDADKRVRNVYSVSFLHPDLLLADLESLLLEEQGAVLGPRDHVVDMAPAPAHAGDFKRGYASGDYETRSVAVQRRRGEPADLPALAANPPLGLPPVPVPADNPLTSEKVQLGRKLFYDRRLSLNGTFSCAMCHIPEQGFTNNEMATAVGIEGRTVRRNAPTLYNAAYLTRLFLDGRETRLEHQAWQPMLAHNEMGNPSFGAVVDKLARLPDYAGLFEAAFGAGPTMESIGQAIASYERTLLSADSPFDRWRYGGEANALDEPARRGFELFTGKAGCAACHTLGEEYALFTDDRLHNTGLGWHNAMRKEPPAQRVQVAPGVFVEVSRAIVDSVSERRPGDLGRYEVTQDPADRWKYRTPSLRNIALTAPYMHDGSLATLEEVVRYYDRGGHEHALRSPLVRPLGLSDREVDDLVAFLRSLTGSNVVTLVSDAYAAPIGDPSVEDDPR